VFLLNPVLCPDIRVKLVKKKIEQPAIVTQVCANRHPYRIDHINRVRHGLCLMVMEKLKKTDTLIQINIIF